jgi:tryptophan 2,3-dioxygenase
MLSESRTAGAATCPHMMPSRASCLVARSVAPDEELAAEAAIGRWLSSRNADDFPYDAVVAEFHRVGKHFVETELLDALAGVRAALPEVRGSVASVRLLDRFLDAALDKWDGRYANPTYLALSLLPLSEVDDLSHHQDVTAAERQYDRLFVQLVADASRFELAAADGATEMLPQMRPDARTTAKRCRLGLQVAGPAARRLGLSDGVDVDDPIAGARRLWANLAADLSPAERRTLQLTMLPVSLIHDEYQFIRVLQSFEATFNLVAVQLQAAMRAITDGECHLALAHLQAAETRLREAAPLFSLVATMQVEAFHTFREFTEGASAIQSRNYKLLESSCRQPDQARLDSPAYLSVPEVRERVLAGQVTLDDAFQAARASHLSARDIDDLEQVMRQFAATLLRWRRTHYGIAVRMLGEHTGTGYTEGSPYLKAVQTIPVFPSLPHGDEAADAAAQDGESGDEIAPARPLDLEVIDARGRCPFAAGSVSLTMTAAVRA